MSQRSRVRVYLGCSLDGFIAGPNDDLSWLSEAGDPSAPAGDGIAFEAFLDQIGVMLMGRRTYDVVTPFPEWPYGALPVHVVTHRPLDAKQPTVRAVSGDIYTLIAEAKAVAGDKDVYVDGGLLVRQALDAGLVDELVLTFLPILLAGGVSLFDGLLQRRKLVFVEHHRFRGGALQVVARVGG